MQTTKRATGLRTADPNYETFVQQAINKVTGFQQLYKELERAINVPGKSKWIFRTKVYHLFRTKVYHPFRSKVYHLSQFIFLIFPEGDSDSLGYLSDNTAQSIPLDSSFPGPGNTAYSIPDAIADFVITA